MPLDPHDHIVDTLIGERAPRLSSSPIWPLIRPALYRLLDYRKARAMADHIAPLPGRQALDYVSDLLGVKVSVRGLDHVPATGRVVLICNHPTGIGDGVAVYDALKTRRPEVCFYANADAHRVSPGLGEVLIPVEWVEAKRTRERTRLTLNLTRQAMDAERALVIFPAGRLARKQKDGTLLDPPWMPSAVSIARKFEAPIIPMHLDGPWSTLFHLFNDYSAQDNVLVALPEVRRRGFDAWRDLGADSAAQDKSSAVLDRVGLKGKEDVAAKSLSYGERRALEIAIALATEPRLLFLDEPTAGLGNEGTARLAELIRELKRVLTIVVIEHDMKFLFGLADRISVIHWGQVIAEGTPGELRENPWVQRSNLGALA